MYIGFSNFVVIDHTGINLIEGFLAPRLYLGVLGSRLGENRLAILAGGKQSISGISYIRLFGVQGAKIGSQPYAPTGAPS